MATSFRFATLTHVIHCDVSPVARTGQMGPSYSGGCTAYGKSNFSSVDLSAAIDARRASSLAATVFAGPVSFRK